MSKTRPTFVIQSRDSSEELAKEENGLLSTTKEHGDDPRSVSSSSIPYARAVQIFFFGFFSNLIIVVVVWVCINFLESATPQDAPAQGPQQLSTPIDGPLFLNDTHAYSFLLDSEGRFSYSQDYFLLQQGFEAQVNQAYCGVASATAMLNSFRHKVVLPVDYEYDPYPYATQEDVFDECVTSTVVYHDDEFDGIFAVPFGLGMSQVRALLKCFFPESEQWQVDATHLDPYMVSLDQMRSDMIDLLTNKYARVLVNFERSVVHEEGGGHWSPVGSYSPAIDAFLVLDVAKYKYPATWVPARLLYQAMATKDECGNWKFPFGQSELPEKLLYPESSDSYEQASKQLDCQQSYRGYLGVRRKKLNN